MSKTPDGILSILNPEEVFNHVCNSLATVDRCMAHPDPTKQIVKFGYIQNPKKVSEEQPFGVGQFINDGARPEFGAELDFAEATTVHALVIAEDIFDLKRNLSSFSV